MKKETNRYLWEHPDLFNGCWHAWKNHSVWPEGYFGIKCTHCNKFLPVGDESSLPRFHPHYVNPDFFTWNGFGKLWEKCKEQEWWKLFLLKLIYAPSCHDYLEPIDYDGLLPESLIDPLTFPTRVREFMEGRE